MLWLTALGERPVHVQGVEVEFHVLSARKARGASQSAARFFVQAGRGVKAHATSVKRGAKLVGPGAHEVQSCESRGGGRSLRLPIPYARLLPHDIEGQDPS